MKLSLLLKFLIIFVSVFSCKQLSATIILQNSIITAKTKNAQNSFEYKYVTAKSGLNFRDSPKGKILGKFPLNTGVKVNKHTKIFESIIDGGKNLKGEWVGVEKEEDTVYVFDAYLSYSYTLSDIKIYYAQPFDNKNKNYYPAFLNVSESYFYYTENENTILSKDEELKDTIIINKKQRKEFLKKINVSESDSIFIYEIGADLIHTYKVKDLPAIACLNIFSNVYPNSTKTERDFEFGFDLKKSYRGSYQNFAFVGKENPFQTGKLKPVFWEKIEGSEFPENFKKDATLHSQKFSFKDVVAGESFKFSNNQYHYYLQNLQNEKRIYARYLVIIDSITKMVVLNRVYSESEGTFLNQLNLGTNSLNTKFQWTGDLFKNKPPIIFGFLSSMFGCPSIDFLSESEPSIPLLCDNRH